MTRSATLEQWPPAVFAKKRRRPAVLRTVPHWGSNWPSARIRGDRLTLTLRDIANGGAKYTSQVDRHTDTVTLRTVNPDVPLEQEIEFTDLDSPEHGDYYVRVRQTNGGTAWSSPIWVGSYATR